MHNADQDGTTSPPGGMRILLVHGCAEPELIRTLAHDGHDVLNVTADDIHARLLRVFNPGLILIATDDCATTCRELRRAAPSIPIVAIASGDSVDERIGALEAGADDCVSRPFQRAELIARVRAVARRVRRVETVAHAEGPPLARAI
jgi:DNA-binding response OmpR family regulator